MQQTHNDRKNHKCKCCHIRQEVEEEEITDSEVTFNRGGGVRVFFLGEGGGREGSFFFFFFWGGGRGLGFFFFFLGRNPNLFFFWGGTR